MNRREFIRQFCVLTGTAVLAPLNLLPETKLTIGGWFKETRGGWIFHSIDGGGLATMMLVSKKLSDEQVQQLYEQSRPHLEFNIPVYKKETPLRIL